MTGARRLILGLVLSLALFGALSCGDAVPGEQAAHVPTDSAVSAVDDAGRTVQLPRPARRIISLLPATTETLFALGAGDRVVARTVYDQGPEVEHLPSVGGGLDPSLEAMTALRPDLVIAWEAAGDAELRNRLEQLGIPVFAVRTQDTTDILSNIQRLGHLTGRDRVADSLATRIRAGLDSVRASVAGLPRPSVFYAVGINPPMDAGPGTFLAELIEVAGGRLAFADAETDWRRLSPQLSLEEIVRRQPELVIVPVAADADPADVQRQLNRPGWRELEAVQGNGVRMVDRELLSRPGPSIVRAAWALRRAIHGPVQ